MQHDANEPFDLLIRDVFAIGTDNAPATPAPICLGIRGQHIAWVGSEPPEGQAARRSLSLPGHLACPGFINMHYHAGLNFVRGVAPDLGFAPSYTRGLPQATQLSAEEATILSTLGAIEALKAGSTTLVDSFVHAEATVTGLAASGARIFASPRLNDVDFASVLAGQRRFDPDLARSMLDAASAFVDNWHLRENGRIRAHITAHAPDTCSADFLQALAGLARDHELKLSTHLAQSQQELAWVGTHHGCTPVALLQKLGLLNADLLAGHCIHVDDADIESLAEAGSHVVHIPLGNAISGRFAPTHKLRRAGCQITLGTDTMHGDMIEAMRWALAIGRMQEGGVSSAWQPADLLTMATRNAAAALGMAGELGNIQAGQLADIVILNMRKPHLTPAVNPLGTIIHNGNGSDVAYVIVDGRIVVADGHCTEVDEVEIMARACEVTSALWARNGTSLTTIPHAGREKDHS